MKGNGIIKKKEKDREMRGDKESERSGKERGGREKGDSKREEEKRKIKRGKR